LDEPTVASAILAHARHLTADGHWRVRTAIVMQDHVHLLVTLGGEAELSKVVRLFKGTSSRVLRQRQLCWQHGCFDHRLRDNEDRLPLFLYVYLNPYRAPLLANDQTWPAYYCAPDDWVWFEPLTSSSCPFPQWLRG
jgi:putative transposase